MSKYTERRHVAEALTVGKPKHQFGVLKRTNKTIYVPDLEGKLQPKVVERRTIGLTPDCTRRVYKNLKRLDDGKFQALVFWLSGATAAG